MHRIFDDKSSGTKYNNNMIRTILCYGDSNTFGYCPETGLRYPKNIRWPGRLQLLLGDEYDVIEEGCNGRTTIYSDPVESWKNGLDYLKPCLNSHKPIDIVILMLGSNDLKAMYGVTAEESAQGAGVLVDVIQSFTMLKQGYVPEIILVSPPELGANIKTSPFSGSFNEEAVNESRRFPEYFRRVADEKKCIFFNAAEFICPSPIDSLHLAPQSHIKLAEELSKVIKEL